MNSPNKTKSTIHPDDMAKQQPEDKVSFSSYLVSIPRVIVKRLKRLLAKSGSEAKAKTSKVFSSASSKLLRRKGMVIPRSRMSEKKSADHKIEQESRILGQENDAIDIEKIAAIRKLGIDELEDIARSEGLNDLVGLSKSDIVEQLCEYYSSTESREKHASHEGDGLKKDDLYKRAQELDISGRSRMTKEELKDAVESAS